MIIFALFACLFSAFQIFFVATPARSISMRDGLAAFLAGMAASFAITLLAELALTALATDETGPAFREIVRAAGYGVDPLVEEICKLLPLLGLILIARVRGALGFTDIVVISAALGAGFGFMESALTLGSAPATARWMMHFFTLSGGGFGMSALAVPDPWATVTAWLPNSTSVLGPMDDPAAILNFHVVYSVFAGIGLAVLLKAPRLWWVWLPALAYAVLDHVGFNAEMARTELPLSLSPMLQALRPLDGLWVLVILGGAIVADRHRFGRMLARDPALKLGEDGNSGARLALRRIRTVRAARGLWSFILERRGHLIAAAAGESGEAHMARGTQLAAVVQALRTGTGGPSPPPGETIAALPAPRRGRRLLTILGIVVAVPPLLYGAAIGFVPPEWLAALLGSPAALAVLLILLAAGLLLQAVTAYTQFRALRAPETRADPRALRWHLLSLQTALGGIAFSLLVLAVSVGHDPLQPIGATHAIQRWLGAHPVAAAMLGAAIAALLSLAIDLSPLGRIRGAWEALTGADMLTGQRLSFLERTLRLLPGRGVRGLAGNEIAVRSAREAAAGFNQAAERIPTLDWSRTTLRAGENPAGHIIRNHQSLSLTKPTQGVFFGDSVSAVEDAWSIASRSGLRPVTIGNRDFYIVPRPDSGYAGGMGGQLQSLDHITIITEAGSSRIVTAYPSGGTPPIPRGYEWLLGK